MRRLWPSCRAAIVACVGLGLAAPAAAQPMDDKAAEEAPAEEAPGDEAPTEATDQTSPEAPTPGDEAATEEADSAPTEEPPAAAPGASELPKCERDLAADKAKAQKVGQEAAPSRPTDLKVEAERLAFEKSVQRYVDTSEDFRKEVHTIVKQAIDKRRLGLTRRYDKLVADVDVEERSRREDAIKRFEGFVRKYPSDDRYTPDAMFRLAELYYERSAVDYQDAAERYDAERALYQRGKIPEEPQAPEREYADSIRVYRQLIQRFGERYRYGDAVYYLLGYVLNEAGEDREAQVAWQQLVDRFPKSEYAPEVLLRVGEILFDNGEFRQASEAYIAAMQYSQSKYYDKALYKLAWTYFQVYDYDQAIKTFKQLIAWYDKNQDASEGTGSALREEAIDYLAKSLAEDDWDADGLKDDAAGVGRALSYLSEGAPYETDIIERYAESLYNLHDRTKYAESIEVYRELLRRQASSPKAIDWQMQVVKIYDVLRDVNQATEERKRLAAMFAADSPWARANAGDPRAQREATAAVERALRERALWHHQRAQELKTQARLEEDPSLLVEAQDQYLRAAEAYQAYLDRYPTEPASYEMAFYLAEALYYSGQFDKAARAYSTVAGHAHHDTYREVAAWSAIKSHEKILGGLVDQGVLDPKSDPLRDWAAPPAEGGDDTRRVTAETLPEAVRVWIEAIDFYVIRDLQRDGGRKAQSQLAYQAADMHYRYRDLPEARRRYEQILSCHPTEEVAANAIANIINSYREENDWPNLEKWADLADRLALGNAEQQAAIRKEIKVFKLGAQFQHAEALLAAKSYLEAAREFERLADQNPDAPFADKAYYNAASAYKEVKYYDSASRLFEKLVTDSRFNKSEFAEDSLFELAENYKLFFQFDKATTAYLALVGRYESSENRSYALYQAATLQENNGDTLDAARTYERYAGLFGDRPDAATALFRAGELYEKLGDEREQERVWKAFVDRFRGTVGMDNRVVLATMRLGDLAKKQGKTSTAQKHWQEVLREFSARALEPGGEASVAAAKARYELIELRFQEYAAIRLRGNQKKQALDLSRKQKFLGELQNEYADVFQYKAVDWTICAYVRLGDLFKEFAATLYAAPEPDGLSEEELDAYIVMIEDEGLKYENVAIERYETTVEQSRRLKVTNQCARQALEAINKYQPDKYPLFKEEKLRAQFEPLYTIDTRAPEVR